MNYELLDQLTLLSPGILLIGICIGTYQYGKLNKAYRMMFFYLIGCLVFDIMTRLPFLVWKTNLVLLVLFSLFELLLFYRLYLQLYEHKKNLILVIVVPLGLCYIMGELFWINFRDPANFQSYAKVVDTICVVSMATGYFFDQLIKSSRDMWNFFRTNGIVLICFLFYIVFFVPINFLIVGSNAQLYLWLIHLIVTIGFYMYIISELWRNGKNRKQLPFG